jgi:hypothetical protein
MNRAHHAALSIAAAALISACGDDGPLRALTTTVEDDPADHSTSDFPILTARDFRFRRDDFNWEIGGSEIFDVDARGQVTELFAHGEVRDGVIHVEWRSGTYRLSRDELRELQQLLVDQDFPELALSYVDESGEDGWSATYWLVAGGQRKKVRCSNVAPAEITRIAEHVRAVCARHRSERDRSAVALTAEQARARWTSEP